MKIVKLSNDKLDKNTKLIVVGEWNPEIDFSQDAFFVKKKKMAEELMQRVGLPSKKLLPR